MVSPGKVLTWLLSLALSQSCPQLCLVLRLAPGSPFQDKAQQQCQRAGWQGQEVIPTDTVTPLCRGSVPHELAEQPW